MNPPFWNFVPVFFLTLFLMGCSTTPGSDHNSNQSGMIQTIDSSTKVSEYKTFAQTFENQNLPYSLPAANQISKAELDKKYITDLLSADFTPAFGKDDVLPALSEDLQKSKYYPWAKFKIDSFDGYIIHKQDDDDYYFLCIFDKQGRFTDGTWIAFTEGTDDDGTIREASLNEDGSIEISQYNVQKGKADKAGAERHFYEITSQGKIRDLKENANPGNA